jgi:hypothetical protein
MKAETNTVSQFPKGEVSYFPETDTKVENGVARLGERTGNFIVRDVWRDNLNRRCTTFVATVFREEHAKAICDALNKEAA